MDSLPVLEKNKQLVRQLYDYILNEHRFELLDNFISPGYTGVNGEKGTAAFRKNIQSLLAGFPDLKFTVHDVIAEGNKVAVRWTWKGTNTQSFRDYPVTNKTAVNEGIVIYELTDGKIATVWLQADRLGVLQQIGIIPQNPGIPVRQ